MLIIKYAHLTITKFLELTSILLPFRDNLEPFMYIVDNRGPWTDELLDIFNVKLQVMIIVSQSDDVTFWNNFSCCA